MEEMRNITKILDVKTKGKKSFGRQVCIWQDNIKINLAKQSVNTSA
jgi:hypothetical protein